MALRDRSAATPPISEPSLLSQTACERAADGGDVDLTFLSDLNFDQVIENVAGDREERELIRELLSQPAPPSRHRELPA